MHAREIKEGEGGVGAGALGDDVYDFSGILAPGDVAIGIGCRWVGNFIVRPGRYSSFSGAVGAVVVLLKMNSAVSVVPVWSSSTGK